MNPTSIALIKSEFNHGDTLGCVEGHMTKVFPRKASPPDAKEPWSFQNGELVQQNGDTIKVKFKGCEDMTGWKGRFVRINCHVNDKNKRTGLYVEDEEYQGNKVRMLKITPSASIMDAAQVSGGEKLAQHYDQTQQRAQGPPQAPPQQSAPPPPREESRQAPPPRQTAPQQGEKEILMRTRERIAKIAGLQQICFDAAVHAGHKILERHGVALAPGSIGIMGDKIFMETIRRTEIDLLPMDPHAIIPYRGKPLTALIEVWRSQIAEGKSEIEFESAEKRHELGRAAMAAAANTPPPVQPPPRHHEDPPPRTSAVHTDEGYFANPDDDGAPF